jgi:hypothetical protein
MGIISISNRAALSLTGSVICAGYESRARADAASPIAIFDHDKYFIMTGSRIRRLSDLQFISVTCPEFRDCETETNENNDICLFILMEMLIGLIVAVPNPPVSLKSHRLISSAMKLSEVHAVFLRSKNHGSDNDVNGPASAIANESQASAGI